jgi:glycosyltransferase involved in cell wall biosynthesis
VTRVGFVLVFDGGWLGGLNYFKNLVTAIYSLPDRRIEVVVFTTDNAEKAYLNELPDIEIIRSKILRRNSFTWLFRKMCQYIVGRDILLERLLAKYKIEVLSHSGALGRNASIPSISWIPDFQHCHLPEFFTEKEIASRNRQYEKLCRNSTRVLLSSFDAQKDLKAIFPECFSKSEVLQFVAAVNQENVPTLKELQVKYQFSDDYFLVPNQFWAHKNHRVLLEALNLLKNSGRELQILATGNSHDHRQPAFFSELMSYAKASDIESNFRVLGVIPKRDLDGLMKYALALINPSLFEGWNTTVEEAKTLGKCIILSDIAVHREQDPPNGIFFPPQDATALAKTMWQLAENGQDKSGSGEKQHEDFLKRREKFANTYQDIVMKVIGTAR